jgi:hypothetical protein
MKLVNLLLPFSYLFSKEICSLASYQYACLYTPLPTIQPTETVLNVGAPFEEFLTLKWV